MKIIIFLKTYSECIALSTVFKIGDYYTFEPSFE